MAHIPNRPGLTSGPAPVQHTAVAAKSATGCGSPNPEAHKRPSHDVRRFLFAGIVRAGAHVMAVLWRAVRGGRKARRSSGRSTNRVPSVTSFGSEVAVSQNPEDHAMNQQIASAQRAPFVPNTRAACAALDELQQHHDALGAIIDLLSIPVGEPDTLAHVSRNRFAVLANMLNHLHEEGGELAEGYMADGYAAMTDLLTPDDMLSREHLGALLHIVREREQSAALRLSRALRGGEVEE